MPPSRLIAMTATAVVDLLKKGEITPFDCLDAAEARVKAVNPATNALVTLAFDRARSHAARLMEKPVAERGLLAGLPVAIKDLVDVAGVRSTQASPIFAQNVPETSDIVVQTIEGEGGLVFAMSNTPEFGAGAHTFNEVFGVTRNPWNLSRSAAGSSGGAAVALATGMAWLAHGSDNGGSLRSPASFNSVVGLRPSPGRVARTPGSVIDDTLSVEGPMGRTVEDVALFLDAMSGAAPGDPMSVPRVESFLAAVRSGTKPLRVAYSPDLGITPVDKEIKAITSKAAQRFAEAGVVVEEAHPDLSELHEAYQTLRSYRFAVGMKPLFEAHRDKLKPDVIWNIKKGLAVTVEDLIKAENARAAMTRRMVAFFETYDLLLTPATIVGPFPIEKRFVGSCASVPFGNYIQWLAIAFAITITSMPALSLPCGFTAEGLPVGLQMVGPPRGEGRLLASAKVLEDILGLKHLTPIDPRKGA